MAGSLHECFWLYRRSLSAQLVWAARSTIYVLSAEQVDRATFGIPTKWLIKCHIYINCYSWNNSKNYLNYNISKNDLWNRMGYIVIHNRLAGILNATLLVPPIVHAWFVCIFLLHLMVLFPMTKQRDRILVLHEQEMFNCDSSLASRLQMGPSNGSRSSATPVTVRKEAERSQSTPQ